MTPSTRLCPIAAGSLPGAKKISTMRISTVSLGIDLAQLSFWAALRLDQHRILKQEFTNDRRGFCQLRWWLKRHGVTRVRVAVESTNVYAEALLQWLYERGHEVFLLNPERVMYYTRTLGQRNKTDQADCVAIASFIALHEATPW